MLRLPPQAANVHGRIEKADMDGDGRISLSTCVLSKPDVHFHAHCIFPLMLAAALCTAMKRPPEGCLDMGNRFRDMVRNS